MSLAGAGHDGIRNRPIFLRPRAREYRNPLLAGPMNRRRGLGPRRTGRREDLARHLSPDCDLVGHRRFAMQPARRLAVDWAMAGWFHFAADCLALLILAIAVAGLVGIVVSALRDP